MRDGCAPTLRGQRSRKPGLDRANRRRLGYDFAGMFNWLKRRQTPPATIAPALDSGGFTSLFGAQATRPAERGQGPRTVAIIGACLAETLARGLARSPVLAGSFRFVAVPLHVTPLTDPGVQSSLAEASHIFLQTNMAETAFLRAHAPAAQIVLFPDIVLRCLWPFDAASGYHDEAIPEHPTGIIRHPDGILARLRKVEPDPRRRFELYRALAFDEASTIERQATVQARFLDQIDEETDAGLGAFITQHIRTRPLFYNSTHPSGAVFQALGAFFWRKLEMAGRAPEFTGMDDWKVWSVPVHPGVARRLGVTWATERTRYHYDTLGEVTWEEWVRAYIEHCG